MKQLEPIFKYHFWILLFLGLIMAFTGWWMATSTMQAAIKDRKGKIDTAEKSIPKDEVPSADYEAKLKDINARQKHKVDESRTFLYARQKEKMVWPPGVLSEQAAKLKYRGEFDSVSPLIFRSGTGYSQEVKRVYQIPRPINPLDGSGIVDFPESRMPSKDWGNNKPTSQEMWDAMEDLWLLEPILQAIRAVNGGADSERFDAVVVSIDELKLLGGDRSKIGAKVDATAGGGGADDVGAGFGRGNDRRGDRAGRTPVGGAANGPGLDINAADELGDATGTRVTEDPDAASSPADFGRGGGSLSTERRYVDDDPSQPFRTRGFKLTVTMNHRRLPDFFAELTSTEGSPWPIQILRMHMMQAGAVSGGNSRGGGGGGIGGNAFNNNRGRRDRDDDGRGGGGGGPFFNPNRGGTAATDSNQATLETAYLAKVTLIGLITLYNEPEALESSGGSTSPTTAATTAAGAADGDSEATAATGELAPADDAEAMTASEDDAAAEGQPDGAASEAMPESSTDDETQPTPSSEETDETPAKTDDSAATENKE